MLKEDIENISLQDVQLIALKVVTERIQEEIKKDEESLDYYEKRASGTLDELNKAICDLKGKISWNTYLLDMLTTDSLKQPNDLNLSPKQICKYMDWDFNIHEGEQNNE
jgi:hypothetical protein